MADHSNTDRRTLLKILAAGGVAGAFSGLAVIRPVVAAPGAMVPGMGWVKSPGRQEGDGTPVQFIPKNEPDPNPLQNELEKYPRCPYCGMSISKWHHSRHLVHYDDDLADGICSIHCLAISLSLNLDRGPKAIYAADFGSDAAVKPLVEVDKATYLLGSGLKGTMTKNSKMAFADKAAAAAAQAKHGGELADFDAGLKASYLGMAEDTIGIRKRRAERRRRMMEKMKQKG